MMLLWRTGTTVVRWAAATLLALHVALVLWTFPARHGNLVDPFATADTSFYIASGLDVVAAGAMTGYSVSHLAGYPLGSWMSLGKKAYESVMRWGPSRTSVFRYWLFVVAMAVLTPVVIGLAVAALGCSANAAWACAGATAVAFHLADPLCSSWGVGASHWQFGSALAVLATALCWRPSAWRAVLAGLVMALAIWIHTISFMPLGFGLLAIVCGSGGGAEARPRWLAIAGALLLAGLLLLPSHWHYLHQLDLRIPMRPKFLASGPRFMVFDFLDDRAYARPYDRRAILHALLVLGTWQALADTRPERRGLRMFWLAAVFCLGTTWLFGTLPVIRELQTYRLLGAAELFLIAPASYGLRRLVNAVREANPPGRAAALALGLCLLPAFTGSLLMLLNVEPMHGLSEDAKSAVAWIGDRPGPGRIGCDADGLGNLLPYLTGREVIGGGVSNHAVVPEAWASIDRDWAFGRALEELTPNAFQRGCSLLDVRVLVVEAPRLIALVEETQARLAATFGELRIYTLEPAPAPELWAGCYQGKVDAGANRITIHDAPTGRFVIDYHYDRQLQAPAGVSVAPQNVPDAGAPFIAVDNSAGLQTIDITAGHGS